MSPVGRDKQLVDLFVKGLNRETGAEYRLRCYPDEQETQEKAADAIYSDPVRGTLAIEHTLVQAFEGQKKDAIRFNRVLAPLWSDKSLAVPGYRIVVDVPAFSVPNRVDWDLAGRKLAQWFRRKRSALPEGESEHTVQGLGFDLHLTILNMEITKWVPSTYGVVHVRRVIAHGGYDSDPLRERLARRGIELIAPHHKNRTRPPTQDGRTLRRYKRRWIVERTIGWLWATTGAWSCAMTARWPSTPRSSISPAS